MKTNSSHKSNPKKIMKTEDSIINEILIHLNKTKRDLRVSDDCNILLWFVQKFPWLTLEQIDKYFYPNISRDNNFFMKRVNNLVKKGLLQKWKLPRLHYTISKAGIEHLDYWDARIKHSDTAYKRTILAHQYGIEYIQPSEFEPRFQDYSHSNKVIETALTLSKTGKFNIVEALDYVINKRQSLFVNNFPDILLMKFEEKAVLRFLIEIENTPITLSKLVSKLVRNYRDAEGNSDLVENLGSQEGKPVHTFHFFFCTSPQFLQYYVRSIRQILGTNFEQSLSESAWQNKWTSMYKLEKWEKNLKFNSASFQRWLQKGRVFFGMLPDNFDFQNAELLTYDNPKYYPNNPVIAGAGTDKGIKSFEFSALLK